VAVYLKARERNDPASILLAVQTALVPKGIIPAAAAVEDQEDPTRSAADATSGMSDDELAKQARELIQGALAAAGAAAPRDPAGRVGEITVQRAEARKYVSHWLSQDARITARVVDLIARLSPS
jgi:hypothetical protein